MCASHRSFRWERQQAVEDSSIFILQNDVVTTAWSKTLRVYAHTLTMPLKVAWRDELNLTRQEWTTTNPKEGEYGRRKSLKGIMTKPEHGSVRTRWTGRWKSQKEKIMKLKRTVSFSELVSSEYEIEKCLVVCQAFIADTAPRKTCIPCNFEAK